MEIINYTFKTIMQKIIGGCLGTIIASLFFIVIFSVFFTIIWNAVMPDIFGVNEITYLKSFGLLCISRMIFPNITINNKE